LQRELLESFRAYIDRVKAAPVASSATTKASVRDLISRQLAGIAATNPELKALMKTVAAGKASKEQLNTFEAHIDRVEAAPDPHVEHVDDMDEDEDHWDEDHGDEDHEDEDDFRSDEDGDGDGDEDEYMSDGEAFEEAFDETRAEAVAEENKAQQIQEAPHATKGTAPRQLTRRVDTLLKCIPRLHQARNLGRRPLPNVRFQNWDHGDRRR
jgi:hypothetical protein